MKKRIVSVLLLAAMLTLLTSCKGASSQLARFEPGQKLKIAICSSSDTITDGGFVENNYDGIKDFVKSRGYIDRIKPIYVPSGDPEEALESVEAAVENHDIFVLTGYVYNKIAPIAQAHPDKYFILVDDFPINEEGEIVTLDNVYSMTFAENEAGFLAGVAAALESKSHKIAMVCGVVCNANMDYMLGYKSGIYYANRHLNTGAELMELLDYAGIDENGESVGGNFVGSFNDPETATKITRTLIEQGCDVIFSCCGASGRGVFSGVKYATQVSVIGCDTDQYGEGKNGTLNIVLTSVFKDMSVNVERQLHAIEDGTFRGGNHMLRSDTASTGYVKAEEHHHLSDNTIQILDALVEKLKDGVIVPASYSNGNAPDNFPGLDYEWLWTPFAPLMGRE